VGIGRQSWIGLGTDWRWLLAGSLFCFSRLGVLSTDDFLCLFLVVGIVLLCPRRYCQHLLHLELSSPFSEVQADQDGYSIQLRQADDDEKVEVALVGKHFDQEGCKGSQTRN
jgi:hypothetical protein